MKGKIIVVTLFIVVIAWSWIDNEKKKEKQHYMDAYNGWIIETEARHPMTFNQWKALYGSKHKP